jgi:hypothetical protein
VRRAEAVREAFTQNFGRRRELGGAGVCMVTIPQPLAAYQGKWHRSRYWRYGWREGIGIVGDSLKERTAGSGRRSMSPTNFRRDLRKPFSIRRPLFSRRHLFALTSQFSLKSFSAINRLRCLTGADRLRNFTCRRSRSSPP